ARALAACFAGWAADLAGERRSGAPLAARLAGAGMAINVVGAGVSRISWLRMAKTRVTAIHQHIARIGGFDRAPFDPATRGNGRQAARSPRGGNGAARRQAGPRRLRPCSASSAQLAAKQ